jgi:GT2 family glycosyltransferase
VQHQGVVLGIGGFAGHLFRHFPADECRHFSQGLVRQYSAVTGACLMTKKALFQSLGGFDAVNLKIALNDVDYCLKVRDHGLRVIYTPYAQLYHFESKSRGYEDTPEKLERLNREGKYLIKKWRNLIGDDPFYNPNLTLDREDLSLR